MQADQLVDAHSRVLIPEPPVRTVRVNYRTAKVSADPVDLVIAGAARPDPSAEYNEKQVGTVDTSPTTADVDDESPRSMYVEGRWRNHGDDSSVVVTARVQAEDEPVLPRFADDESPPVATVVEATWRKNDATRGGSAPPEDPPSDSEWTNVTVETTAVPSPVAAVERGRRVLAPIVHMSDDHVRPVPRSARISTVEVALPVPPEHADAVETTLTTLADVVGEQATAPYPTVDTTDWAQLGFDDTGHAETVSLRSRSGQGPTLEASYSSPGSATAPPVTSGSQSQVVEHLRRKIAAVAAWSLPLDDLRSHAGPHPDVEVEDKNQDTKPARPDDQLPLDDFCAHTESQTGAEVAVVDPDGSGGPVPRDVTWTRVPPAPPALR